MSQMPQTQMMAPQQYAPQPPVQQYAPQQPVQQAPQQYAPQPQMQQAPPQQYAPQQQQYPPQQQMQPQYQQQQQAPQQQQQFVPQQPPVQLPYENACWFTGQVAPNQWMPNGVAWKPGQGNSQGHVSVNIKLRKQTSYQGTQRLSISYVRLIEYGPRGQALMNMLQPGAIVRFCGEFKIGGYNDPKTGQFKQMIQFQLAKDINGQMPLQVLGVSPYVQEESTGRNRNTPPQQQFNGQQPMQQQQQYPPQQQQQQYPPQQVQQQPMQQAPTQQYAPQQQQQYPPQQQMQQMPQQAPQQYPPQQMQPQYAPQQVHQQAGGAPVQPAPGQPHGQFVPPQQQQPGPMASGQPQLQQNDIPF